MAEIFTLRRPRPPEGSQMFHFFGVRTVQHLQVREADPTQEAQLQLQVCVTS